MADSSNSSLMLQWQIPRGSVPAPPMGSPTILFTERILPALAYGGYLSQLTFGQPVPPKGGYPGGIPYRPGGGGDVSSPVQACVAKGLPAPPPVSIRVSFFFDGTLNNRTNVALGREFNDDDSYTAGMSNIARLESVGLSQYGPEVDRHFTVYTEGIGTTNGGSDSTTGYALGIGKTGIPAKVERGITAALSNIGMIMHGLGKSKRKIERIHIDTFGFSRGAAAARHCVWQCMQKAGGTLKERLEAMGFTVGEVAVKFVGLYDTVASYRINHDDDTADLHLDAISIAEKVVQLAAAEEHRAKFRLTNINSAGDRGREIFLPGVHSDVGGGYADTEDEVGRQLFDLDVIWLNDAERAAIERERRWLVASGWYRADELAPTNFWNEVRATRRGISNAYSRIPLRIMAKFARENGVHIAATLKLRYPIPPELSTAYSEIQAYVGRASCSSPGDWFKTDPAGDPAWHIAMRHGYLHFSARYGTTLGAHAPQWSNGGPVNGHRARVIQDG